MGAWWVALITLSMSLTVTWAATTVAGTIAPGATTIAPTGTTGDTWWTLPPTDSYPNPNTANCGIRIPLMASQQAQIDDAARSGLIDRLRSDRAFTYSNTQPIVTNFTDEQLALLKDNGPFGSYFNREQDHNLEGLRFWSDDVQPLPDQCAHIDTPLTRSRRKRSTHAPSRVCPVRYEDNLLVTALNADDEPLQIIQLYPDYSPDPDAVQWKLRQKCQSGGPVAGGSSIGCAETIRIVYLLAIRLSELDDGDITGMHVQPVQVESCTTLTL